MKKLMGLLILVTLIGGCLGMRVDKAPSEYRSAVPQIKLGDTKEKVLAILLPRQEGIPDQASRSMVSYMQDGKVIEVYFMRDSEQLDGSATEEGITPYVFTDGKLTTIGCRGPGGAKP